MISRNKRIAAFLSLMSMTAALALPAPALAQTSKPISVRFQDTGSATIFLPYLLSRTEYFEQNGVVAVPNPPMFAAAPMYNVLLQNQADISYTGPTPIVPLVQQGRPLKIIAVISRGFEVKVALTKPALEALAKKGITPDSPLATRVQALRGLRIGSPPSGSTIEAGFIYSLKRNGLDPTRDLTVQPLPDLNALIAAARQASVDGIVGTNAYGVGVATSDGSSRVFIEFEKHDEGLAVFPFNVLVATDEYVQKNPEAVRRVLASFNAAKNAIRKGITQQQRDRVKNDFFRDMNPDIYRNLTDAVLPQLTGSMVANKAQLDVLLGINNATVATPANLSFEQVFNTRLAEEIEKK